MGVEAPSVAKEMPQSRKAAAWERRGMRLRMGRTFATVIAVSLAVGVPAAIAGSGHHGKAQKVYVVCKHGCKYGSVHAAVKAVTDGSNSVIKIRPGTYKEGVTLVGHKYDGLSFVGSSGK